MGTIRDGCGNIGESSIAVVLFLILILLILGIN